ncbi:AraC family ligand binding domain-containing protein [Photobacterium sp. Alg240-V54]|uniref:AraC family ligand binding domain-containing protein n=1 Tax=Photobacterium sp. Alg240-V54 TaxID=2305995 RepID=UPI0013D01862|nr:AraC family ligand binding domain-containing protein [Photobacterium sp. Alg240-V54]
MKQAIEFSQNEHPFLFVGSRRKSHNAYFIVVTSGSILMRLGKHEHLVSKGHGFWVPFDCLHALTVLPGTCFFKVAFSIRLQQPLCRDAGFFVVSPLLDALLVELTKLPTEKHDWNGAEGRLLKVIADQISNLSASTQSLSPAINKQYHNALALLLNGNKITEQSAVQAIEPIIGMTLKEFESCITIREALKLIRSGRKLPQIAAQLNTSEVLLEALAMPILGKAF